LRLERLRVLDETRSFTVVPTGPSFAKIDAIFIECFQPDGTWLNFGVHPAGQVPEAVPGIGNLRISPLLSYVAVRNASYYGGELYCKILDDQNVILLDEVQYVDATLTVLFPKPWGPNDPLSITMPNRNYVISVEAGHV